EGSYDAIVLDILLPGMNGYKVCETLRDEGVWTPILMLTAKDGEWDEAEALDTGADDFLSKPFSFVVLLARLRALFRRGAPPRPACCGGGPVAARPGPARCRRGRRVDQAHRTRVRTARVPHATRRQRRVKARDPRPRLGHGFRRRSQCRRGLHRLSAAQGRPAVRRSAHPHRARRGLPPLPRMIRRLSVRWRITLVASGLFAVALGLASFVLVREVRSNLVDGIRSNDEQQLARLAAQLEQGIPSQVNLGPPPPRGYPPIKIHDVVSGRDY